MLSNQHLCCYRVCQQHWQSINKQTALKAAGVTVKVVPSLSLHLVGSKSKRPHKVSSKQNVAAVCTLEKRAGNTLGLFDRRRDAVLLVPTAHGHGLRPASPHCQANSSLRPLFQTRRSSGTGPRKCNNAISWLRLHQQLLVSRDGGRVAVSLISPARLVAKSWARR